MNDKKNILDENGSFTHTLSAPFEWEGKTYTELTLNLEGLTGQDGLDVESELADEGKFIVITPEFNTDYIYRMAARAAGVDPNVIKHLPYRDAAVIRNKTKNFMSGV